HLAYECKNVDSETRIKVLHLLSNDFVDSDNNTASTSTTKTSKRQKLNIDHEYENIPTSLSKEDQINKILLKIVVCCNLPFALVEHPFFQEYTKALHATYPIPKRIINNDVNLTIAVDEWTNPKESIDILKIKGRDLKDHTKTRWSTMWDCISSII
ncbi:8268_t:CDS:2, partial [Scutellospora calospora]